MSEDRSDAWKYWVGFLMVLAVCYLIGQSSGSGNVPPDCYATAQDAATGGC